MVCGHSQSNQTGTAYVDASSKCPECGAEEYGVHADRCPIRRARTHEKTSPCATCKAPQGNYHDTGCAEAIRKALHQRAFECVKVTIEGEQRGGDRRAG